MPTKRGFAAIPKSEHLQHSSKGGKVRVPKGTATLTPEARIQRAKDAANTRWDKVRKEKNEQQTIISSES